jgi:uncharacterized membrane protein (DUF485 family)
MTVAQPTLAQPKMDAERRKKVRRTAIVAGLIALAFYFGFIAMMVYRATR